MYTDHLGSILTLTDLSGNIVAEQNFDAWGRNRNPDTWDYANLSTSTPAWLYRGYTGHEHLQQFGLINMNGRMYDPIQGRMLSPDNYVSTPYGTQGYNRYTYALNNPLVITDPDGNLPIAPIIIGAVMGMYSGGQMANGGEANPLKWQWNFKTFAYMQMGGLIGGVSGLAGGLVSTSGIPFANTLGLMAGSFTNSVGMHALSGGKMPISMSFGIGSYNFSSGEFGYLGKAGNSSLENLGYAFGAMANVQDAFAGFNGGEVEVLSYSEKGKTVSHSAVYSSDGKVNISVAGTTDVNYIKPEGTFARKLEYLYKHLDVGPGGHYTDYQKIGTKTSLYNVNKVKLTKLTDGLKLP